MGSGQAGKGMGNAAGGGRQGIGTSDPKLPDEGDLSQQAQGNNQLQGNDQAQVRNERGRMPGETTRTQGVVEAFELQDPKKRAEWLKQPDGD